MAMNVLDSLKKTWLSLRLFQLLFYVGYLLAFIMTLLALKLAIYDVGADYQQGTIFKLLYLHVPSAWFSLLLLFVSANILVLQGWGRRPWLTACLRTSIRLGTLCTIIVLITGYLWGRAIWGGMIFSDPRISAQIIVMLMYISLIALGQLELSTHQYRWVSLFMWCLTMFVIGVNHFSVYMFETIHQLPTVLRADGQIKMQSSMRPPLWWATAAIFTIIISMFFQNMDKKQE